MKILPVNQPGSPWRVIGQRGDVSLCVSPDGKVKVQVGDSVAVIPVAIAVALQTQEARQFLGDPVVAEFLFAPAERTTRIKAAERLADSERLNKRRAFVALLLGQGVCPEHDAWIAAGKVYP